MVITIGDQAREKSKYFEVLSQCSMEEKCKKAKWLSEEALQIAAKRREVKNKGEKDRYKHLNAEFQRIARRDKKAFLWDQCKEIEENNRIGKTRDSTPLQYACLENPMDGGAWLATVHGVAKSRTRLSDFTSLLCILATSS